VAALIAEAVRPRGGTALLLDWDEITRLAMDRLRHERVSPGQLARAAARYNDLAAEVRGPLLAAVGGLPEGADLPRFEALDRPGWLEVNIGILRRLMEPLASISEVPDSWLAVAGRAGLDRYLALMLEFLSRRVLGQYDPRLLPSYQVPGAGETPPGGEPSGAALYLVEPNVAAWERQADLPGDDLRRWLILHEMTHAWQFACHPWLSGHLDRQLQELIDVTGRTGRSRGVERIRAVTVGLPGQWEIMRRLQATMTLVEGHGNLVMKVVGQRTLGSFERLEAAHRRRSGERGMLEQLVWRGMGLEMKMRQYVVGERFARAVYDRYGMDVLNLAWEGPEALPRADELSDHERWYRRVVESRRSR
jgi:coenzyme F420 biosynthesis associated uncharacterized protein